jgi:hypothetical protein
MVSRICGFSFWVRKAVIVGKKFSKAVVEGVAVFFTASFQVEVTLNSAALSYNKETCDDGTNRGRVEEGLNIYCRKMLM